MLRHSLQFLFLTFTILGCSGSGEKPGAKSPKAGNGPTGIPMVPGQPDVSVDTALPPVARLPRVTANVTGDSVSISVEPVEFALDYRVYVLPADADISSPSDGYVTARNATYRCAGNRQSRRGIMCAHREAPYRNPPARFPLPESERAQERRIILPLFPQLTEEEQTFIAEAVRRACSPER